MHRSYLSPAASGAQSFRLGLLAALTGLVITLQNPAAVDSASRLLSELDLPTPAQVLEWRPGNPPPWVDGDQLAVDEAEDLPVVASVNRDSETPIDPRQRPQR